MMLNRCLIILLRLKYCAFINKLRTRAHIKHNYLFLNVITIIIEVINVLY